MRILQIHNFYGSSAPSGENQVLQAEQDLLRGHGHELSVIQRHSDEILAQGAVGQLRGAMAVPWNPWMARRLQRTVDAFRPHVVHVHNFFPLISPAVFYTVGQRAARVLTLHNYRLFCPAGIPMRDGGVCTDCLDLRSVWPSLVHGCYRSSRLATLPVAAGIALHRSLGTWAKHVDAFIALSAFQRDRMVAAGLPGCCTYVKPNFFPGNPAVIPWQERRHSVVFVGRVSDEKGVATLLRAWTAWGSEAPELRLVGDGPLREKLSRRYSGPAVRFLGQLSSAAAHDEIARARLLVLPSQWFEGFPMVIAEAFAFGTPVSVSRIGPLPDIVGDEFANLVFEPNDPDALLRTVRQAWADGERLQAQSAAARRVFETQLSSEGNYQALMRIYRSAISASGQGTQ